VRPAALLRQRLFAICGILISHQHATRGAAVKHPFRHPLSPRFLDGVVGGLLGGEQPYPSVLALDPPTGFVGVFHLGVPNFSENLLILVVESFSDVVEDMVNPSSRDLHLILGFEKFPDPLKRRPEAVLQGKDEQKKVDAEAEAGDRTLRYGADFLAALPTPLPLDVIEGHHDLRQRNVFHDPVVRGIGLNKCGFARGTMGEVHHLLLVDVPRFSARMSFMSGLTAAFPAHAVP